MQYIFFVSSIHTCTSAFFCLPDVLKRFISDNANPWKKVIDSCWILRKLLCNCEKFVSPTNTFLLFGILFRKECPFIPTWCSEMIYLTELHLQIWKWRVWKGLSQEIQSKLLGAMQLQFTFDLCSHFDGVQVWFHDDVRRMNTCSVFLATFDLTFLYWFRNRAYKHWVLGTYKPWTNIHP